MKIFLAFIHSFIQERLTPNTERNSSDDPNSGIRESTRKQASKRVHKRAVRAAREIKPSKRAEITEPFPSRLVTSESPQEDGPEGQLTNKAGLLDERGRALQAEGQPARVPGTAETSAGLEKTRGLEQSWQGGTAVVAREASRCHGDRFAIHSRAKRRS